MAETVSLDAKDYAILKELDQNFRLPFSVVGKSVHLSKNTVALRYNRLKQYFLHNVTGINHELLGYTLIKIYYSFDFFDTTTQQQVIELFQSQRHPHMIYAARLYGRYDLLIGLLVRNINDFLLSINTFNEHFTKKINHKEIQMVYQENYLRHNFFYANPLHKKYSIIKVNTALTLSKTEKKILRTIRHNPRMPLTELAQQTGLSMKTVYNKLKFLEKKGVIMGYFLTLDLKAFGYSTFKLMIQVHNVASTKLFEANLTSHKNVRYVAKMFGYWDYEVDFVCKSIHELQDEIEALREQFPEIVKMIRIISVGKRIATNREHFLL